MVGASWGLMIIGDFDVARQLSYFRAIFPGSAVGIAGHSSNSDPNQLYLFES